MKHVSLYEQFSRDYSGCERIEREKIVWLIQNGHHEYLVDCSNGQMYMPAFETKALAEQYIRLMGKHLNKACWPAGRTMRCAGDILQWHDSDCSGVLVVFSNAEAAHYDSLQAESVGAPGDLFEWWNRRTQKLRPNTVTPAASE